MLVHILTHVQACRRDHCGLRNRRIWFVRWGVHHTVEAVLIALAKVVLNPPCKLLCRHDACIHMRQKASGAVHLHAGMVCLDMFGQAPAHSGDCSRAGSYLAAS